MDTLSSSVKSDDSSPQRDSGSSSPPPHCAICLGSCKNKSFTDSCLHQFCFTCLLTWSKVKPECPLCKQPFRSIIHNVRSNNQYEEYLVEQRHSVEAAAIIDIDRVATAAQRFRYRTTLTIPRRETMAIQELLRHYPFVANVFPRPAPARRRRSPASFRRTVYRHNLWARPLPDFTGRFRDCSPNFYRHNNSQMHRLVPWINRELNYLLNENVGHISYVLTRILELLPQHNINSPEFREAVHRYFGERTEHFLHELFCFASTPYDISGYDRNVQYTTDSRISSMINEVLSSSESDDSGDSDIVVVSNLRPADPPPGPSRIPAPVYPMSYISQPTSTNNVIPIETISHSDTDDDSSEVMVVGYIKPPQDRTPEIVDLLGSDSDVIVQDTQPEPTANSVKVTLKRQRSRNSNDDNSDSDSTFVPTPPSKRRRRRRRSALSSTSDLTLSSSNSDRAWEHISTDTDFYSNDDEPRRNRSKKRSSTALRDKRRRDRRPSCPYHNESRNGQTPETDKRNDRKSQSGKGVKSSNRNDERSSATSERTLTPDRALLSQRAVPPGRSSPAEPATPPERSFTPEPTPSVLDQPSTSGTSSNQKRKSNKERNRRLGNRETRRLRSVVNVMYNSHRNTGESNSSANNSYFSNATSNHKCEEATGPGAADVTHTDVTHHLASSSDSEDNLPLNLTLQKISPSSVDMKCL